MVLPGGTNILLDYEDLERVRAAGPWHVNAKGYVLQNGTMTAGVRAPSEYLHRFIMGCAPGDGLDVDHKNHNPLDNRKENLRICTHAEEIRA